MENISNVHVLKVTYSGATNTRGSRVIIRSDRFKESKLIGFNYNTNSALDSAIVYLQSRGFNILFQAEGKGCDYIITDTFESPKG